MKEEKAPSPEMPDQFWKKIYIAVIVSTVVVISALYAFSRYFG